MPFCNKCGTQNPDGAVFCQNCGTNLGTAANFTSAPVMTIDGRIRRIYAQTLSLKAKAGGLGGHFDDRSDTRKLNDVMGKLQERGARILDVKVSIDSPFAVCVITYESTTPLEIETG